MRYASVCDGIGAAHAAWQPLGWICAWTSEIDPFPMAVVEERWGLPNLGDMTGITDERLAEHGPIDLLVGGTPCQSFSVAGLRKGLADPRGNLALVYLGLVDRARPRWVVWENVPGVLSSGGGRDFGSFLGALGELGYGFAYRVLDAQFVRVESHARAVPQRRRRVFVVGHLGDWRPAAAVLLERQGMCGHPPPRRVAGQGLAADAAPSLVASGRGVERTGETRGQDPVVAIQERADGIASGPSGKGWREDGAAYTMEARHRVQAVAFQTRIGRNGRGYSEGVCPTINGADAGATSDMRPCVVQPVAHSLRAEGFDASEDGTGRGTPIVPQPYPVGNPLTARMAKGINTTCDEGQTPVVQFGHALPTTGYQGDRVVSSGDAWVTLSKEGPNNGGGGGALLLDAMVVRRLTPRECERLQGFPDDHTAITYRGKPAADGPRYKALGNSMAVNVMSWIGQRIGGAA
jgi:DNA (cytosine-5)-methyltransferase 1